ncbi:glycosyltransferase family 4 protein [Demequina gelatinilytica]|uniref:glycosyltransferase family 4 protein n=1 Tax=Demequina gelatinilytica TaxID=1638980 RepID=UPI00078382F5|nr:glycosyltransferase family 4 protein [Demequina gelatinilytica]
MNTPAIVTIIQEYVPRYRAPLFREMRRLAAERGIDLRIVAGTPQGAQAARRDGDGFQVDEELRQREIRIAGRRIGMRRTSRHFAESDLVVVEQARRNLDVYAAVLRGRRNIAMWGHGRDFTRASGRVSRGVLDALTRRATWFFGYTEDSVEAAARAGVPEGRCTVLWNTTDTRSLRSDLSDLTPDEVARFREGLGVGPVAVFIGGLDSSKRLDFLVRACEEVAPKVEGFSLVVLGAGPAGPDLQALAAERPWMHVRPPAFGRELAIAFASADALAMPGRVGLIAVDALAARVPVVTTDWHGHAPERAYLTSENSVTSHDSPSAYAEALSAVLSDRALNARLRAACEGSDDLLSIEAMAARFMSGIEGALDAS